VFFTERKLHARIQELEPYRYRGSRPLSGMRYAVDQNQDAGAYPPSNGDWQDCELGRVFRGRDLYVWLAMQADIPSSWRDKRILGRFDFGQTGPGHTRGSESLLFVNGRPYQGVDSNHKEVFFPSDFAGEVAELHFRLWSGLEGGGQPQEMEMQLREARLCWLDEATDDLYYTAFAVWETISVLPPGRPEREDLLQILDRAMLQVDWSRPGSDSFYSSVETAQHVLHAGLTGTEQEKPVQVTAVGHTHIDVAWLWRLKHTRDKCARSFATVLRLMELFPEYIFLQTQPQLYQYIKRDYPELYQEMRDRIDEGRWEADGGMWVEADCNVTSGESLVRQILYGSRFLHKEFGVRCRYLWLPDVFGYSAALPQILRRSGIDTFMTTKISWNQYNEIPHDTFQWRGLDGSEVLTHFITAPDMGGAPFYTYNGEMRAPVLQGIWDNYKDKQINKELLLAYGFGDGGGGVNRDMLELRRRFDDMPGMPKVETGRAGEYFERLHETVQDTDRYVHTWDGELYLEYHRGTYTSQAAVKRWNRLLELELRQQEWLEVMRAVLVDAWDLYPQKKLAVAWKTLLLHQFHDIIPGSSIREVYEDTLQDYEAVFEDLADLQQDAVETMVNPDDPFSCTVYNPGPFTRRGLVEIPLRPGMEEGRWQDKDGQVLQAVTGESIWYVVVYDVPPMGWTTIRFVPGGPESCEDSQFTIHSSGIDTPFYRVAWDGHGHLTQVYDRQYQRDVLSPGARGNVLQVFEDKPMAHDAWDIDIFYQDKMDEVRELVSAELVEHNCLRCTMRFRWRWGESAIEQDMVLYSNTRRIDFKTHVDWHERQQLLKVAFPVDIRAAEATYDIQFGNVKRPTHWNTSWDWARFETVGHMWADLSEEGYGVSLLNDCKYGHDIKDNVIRLSLLKSAVFPDYDADQGEHEFTYSLFPHPGRWLEGETVEQAWKLNKKLLAIPGNAQQEDFCMFRAEGGYIFLDAVKKAEDGDQLIVRFHEYGGGRGKVRLHSDLAIKKWQECNLMEDEEGEANHGPMEFYVTPYQLRTVKVWLQ